MFLHSQKFTWWLSMVKKYLIRLNGATTQGFLNKCSKSHKILLLHELFSICFGFWLGTQTRKKCSSLSSALFLLPKTKLTSVTKLLNVFSLSLLQKQRSQRWTLKIIYCGVTNFSGGSLPEPFADLHLFILILVVKWGWAYKLKSTWLKELFARVWLSDKLSPSFPYFLLFSWIMVYFELSLAWQNNPLQNFM